jgi:hypothetical protein
MPKPVKSRHDVKSLFHEKQNTAAGIHLPVDHCRSNGNQRRHQTDPGKIHRLPLPFLLPILYEPAQWLRWQPNRRIVPIRCRFLHLHLLHRRYLHKPLLQGALMNGKNIRLTTDYLFYRAVYTKFIPVNCLQIMPALSAKIQIKPGAIAPGALTERKSFDPLLFNRKILHQQLTYSNNSILASYSCFKSVLITSASIDSFSIINTFLITIYFFLK